MSLGTEIRLPLAGKGPKKEHGAVFHSFHAFRSSELILRQSDERFVFFVLFCSFSQWLFLFQGKPDSAEERI